MKAALTTFVLALGLMTAGTVHAEESVTEKVGTKMNDAGRAVKKGANRAGEALCTDGSAKCALKKGKNRVGEGVDSVKDKGAEVKDKVD